MTDNEEQFKYTKGELIGSGAYGKVYQGLDLTYGSLLAIKVIKLSLNKDEFQRETRAIKHEIAMLKELNHPNIVRYFHTDVSDDG